jgi:hypothetical protein
MDKPNTTNSYNTSFRVANPERSISPGDISPRNTTCKTNFHTPLTTHWAAINSNTSNNTSFSNPLDMLASVAVMAETSRPATNSLTTDDVFSNRPSPVSVSTHAIAFSSRGTLAHVDLDDDDQFLALANAGPSDEEDDGAFVIDGSSRVQDPGNEEEDEDVDNEDVDNEDVDGDSNDDDDNNKPLKPDTDVKKVNKDVASNKLLKDNVLNTNKGRPPKVAKPVEKVKKSNKGKKGKKDKEDKPKFNRDIEYTKVVRARSITDPVEKAAFEKENEIDFYCEYPSGCHTGQHIWDHCRKSVSDMFGRNKGATAMIKHPLIWCRSHYQMSEYADALWKGKTRPVLVKMQLGRMMRQQPGLLFTMVMIKGDAIRTLSIINDGIDIFFPRPKTKRGAIYRTARSGLLRIADLWTGRDRPESEVHRFLQWYQKHFTPKNATKKQLTNMPRFECVPQWDGLPPSKLGLSTDQKKLLALVEKRKKAELDILDDGYDTDGDWEQYVYNDGMPAEETAEMKQAQKEARAAEEAAEHLANGTAVIETTFEETVSHTRSSAPSPASLNNTPHLRIVLVNREEELRKAKRGKARALQKEEAEDDELPHKRPSSVEQSDAGKSIDIHKNLEREGINSTEAAQVLFGVNYARQGLNNCEGPVTDEIRQKLAEIEDLLGESDEDEDKIEE